MNRPQVVIIQGPTGVGKSKWAIEWVGKIGGEIISADSMQVYRYMDIGTAKPTLDEQKRVKHHLIDLVTPDQPFHAALYRTVGRKTIDQLYQDEIPIWVVGGTGLYIKALLHGLFPSPPIDPKTRERLKQEAKERGPEVLYEQLKKIDPPTAAQLHPHDLFRVIRALEVFDSTGIPISFYRAQHRFGEQPYRALKIGLEMDREKLYSCIETRVDRMLERGLLQEVERLMEMGYGPQLKPMQSLGYKQMVQFLLKEIGWDEAVRQIKRETCHYAKRQWTWFKADSEIHWWNPWTDQKEIIFEIQSFWRKKGGEA
ncbi:MAG: tRNA (adenosine(37)-N6)-dimethylallyltransferase MiaA [Syntrophaceae bacterium]|nr:tRNA (adenosine(37)-N6)-dimethylallyltransferase MiaA [Syntrophaceae bacterium]